MNIGGLSPRIKSFYKVQRICAATGELRFETGWSGNTLLTNGRNEFPNQNWFYAVQLGTDATDPAPGQSGLLGYVNGTTNVEEDTWGAAGAAPYYGWRRKRFRFTPGQVSGNLNEVGVGWATASGANLGFRALLEDIDGNQVTVSPLPDEYVDVVCEIRCYPPLGDSTGTVVLNGITYNYIVRAAEVTSSTFWGSRIGDPIGKVDIFGSYWQAYDGDISTINLAPSGVAYPAAATDAYNLAYSNNSYERQMAKIGGPPSWNATTGKKLRSMRFITTLGSYQVQFDSQAVPGQGIPKTDSQNLKVQFKIGWAEAGPIFTGPVPAQAWTNGVAITPLEISSYYQAGLPEPITYTVSAGSLPAGLSLNASTGQISGTPSAVSSGSVTITCENDVGAADTNSFAWTVS